MLVAISLFSLVVLLIVSNSALDASDEAGNLIERRGEHKGLVLLDHRLGVLHRILEDGASALMTSDLRSDERLTLRRFGQLKFTLEDGKRTK